VREALGWQRDFQYLIFYQLDTERPSEAKPGLTVSLSPME